jgi:hypothetical protein
MGDGVKVGITRPYEETAIDSSRNIARGPNERPQSGPTRRSSRPLRARDRWVFDVILCRARGS